MCGCRLILESGVLDELQARHLLTITELDRRIGCLDERAWARSIEWERLGDFLAGVGHRAGAAKAYYGAVDACLDGEYYDYRREHFPSRWLRLRFYDLMAKTAAFCGEDARLKLLYEDPLIRAEYERFCAHDRF